MKKTQSNEVTEPILETFQFNLNGLKVLIQATTQEEATQIFIKNYLNTQWQTQSEDKE